MKRNLRYIYLAISASLLIIAIISFLFVRSYIYLEEYNDGVEHSRKVISRIANIQFLLTEAENSQRGFLLTSDTSFLNAFDRTQRYIYPEIDSLRNLLVDSKVQGQYLSKLYSIVATRYQVLNQTIEQNISGDEQQFYEHYLRGKEVMDSFYHFANKMEQLELEELKEKQGLKDKYQKRTPYFIFLTLFFTLLFLSVAFILIIREITRRYKYQSELEKKINELNTSNGELEQIAFIASHDLQEPLRKMRTFGGRLLLQYKNKLDSDGEMMLNRLDAAARRMQGLIEDLVDYTNLINSEEPIQQVDLNNVIEDARESLANMISSSNATFNVSQLATISGYSYQLQLLFTNLFHNAIKFAKEGSAPMITITSEILDEKQAKEINNHAAHGYLVINVADNGIGFENEFAKKIFVIFQRLHTQSSAYDGKGIGLSICRRVMTNHNGFITAEGQPDEGATFKLYFPI